NVHTSEPCGMVLSLVDSGLEMVTKFVELTALHREASDGLADAEERKVQAEAEIEFYRKRLTIYEEDAKRHGVDLAPSSNGAPNMPLTDLIVSLVEQADRPLAPADI